MRKLKLRYFVVALGFLGYSLNAVLQPVVGAAATSITITSPANGQTFAGNDFKISGTTDPTSTVLIQRDAKVLAQTISGTDGKWTVNLSGLPDGNNPIKAKVIKNTGYAYFVTVNADLSASKINQLRLSDHAINPNVGWPVSTSEPTLFVAPSPSSSIFYTGGLDGAGTKPQKFDASTASPPVALTNAASYPDNPGAGKGDFTSDGGKYYVPNQSLTSVSVIDVATNTWLKDIDIGEAPVTVWRGTNSKMYVTGQNTIKIIDPATDTIIKSISIPCDINPDATTIGFSPDITYPYYFVPCMTGGKVLRYKISDDTLDVSWSLPAGVHVAGMAITFDSKKIYTFVPAPSSLPDADKIRVLDAGNGALLSTIQLQSGAVGFLQSPDFQKLYVATPNYDLSEHNIDIVDLSDNSVDHNPLDEAATFVSSNGSAQDIADVNITVVLGVKTTLANTGARAVSATLLLGTIIGSSSYIYYDYRRHKKPLLIEDPNVHYSLMHHVKVVTLPIMRYRLSIAVQPNRTGEIRHF